MEFITECVLANFDTEVRLKHDIKEISGMDKVYIDIYYWKYYHIKQTGYHYDLNLERPYFTFYADVRLRNVIDCSCQGYERKTVLLQSEWRDGHPTIESVKSLLDDFMVQIKEAKFDKLTGTFTKNAKKEVVEECCVCLENTQTRTNCRHHICLPCWNQITTQKCPICRKDNIHIYCNYE